MSRPQNPQFQDALQELLSYASPDQIRNTIKELFFTWLIESPDLPNNYKQMTEDIYFLLVFLERIEKESSSKP